MKSFRLIRFYFLNALIAQIANPFGFILFFFSKLIRYAMFFIFLYFLTSSVTRVGDYSASQILLFYLIFNLIDTSAQMLFRETYRFRPLVVSGGLDLILVKPFSPLIRVLIGGPDFIDVVMIMVLIAVLSYYSVIFIHPSLIQVLAFLVLYFNALLIAAAFHILVLSTGILTLSVDHMVMIYRDITALFRLPIDFFPLALRWVFLTVIPLGFAFSYPAKMLLGLLSFWGLLTALIVGVISLLLARRFWQYALRQYQSAGG